MIAEFVDDLAVSQASIVVDRIGAKLALLVRPPPALGNVESLVIQGEQETVGAGSVEGHAGDAPVSIVTRVQAVHRVVVKLFVRAVVAPLASGSLVKRVGEPHAPLRVDGQVVGYVELLPLEAVGQDCG